jgi:hypothetical protein
MSRRRFKIVSVLSLLPGLGCFWLMVTPRLASAHHFWLESPLGELGPFEESSGKYLTGLMLTFGILPTLWTLLAVSRRWNASIEQGRKSLGQCLACGYDLRASLGRCPECGTPIFE